MESFFGAPKSAGGGGGGGGGTPAVWENMGCEVNLLSANKNQEGKGAGGQAVKGGATDGWLGGMPGMGAFAPIFKAQTDNEAQAGSEIESKTESKSETESKTEN